MSILGINSLTKSFIQVDKNRKFLYSNCLKLHLVYHTQEGTCRCWRDQCKDFILLILIDYCIYRFQYVAMILKYENKMLL